MKKPTHIVYREHIAKQKARERRKLKKIVLLFEQEQVQWINLWCKANKKKRANYLRQVILAALREPSNTTSTAAESAKKRGTS